jgi:hypothetical protein
MHQNHSGGIKMKLKERLAFMALGGLLVLLWQMPMASSEDAKRKNFFDDILPEPLQSKSTTSRPSDLRLEGAEPYLPDKIGWLVLNLQALYGDRLGSDGIRTDFIWAEGTDINTVTVLVTYVPRADRERVNLFTDSAKGLAKDMAEKFDWDWVKIREEVKMIR